MKFIQVASLAAAFFNIAAAVPTGDELNINLSKRYTCDECTTNCYEASVRQVTGQFQLASRYNSFETCRSRACYPGRFGAGVCTGSLDECEWCGDFCTTACVGADDESCYETCHRQYCVLGSAKCPVPEDACPQCENMCRDEICTDPEDVECFDECRASVCVNKAFGSGVCFPTCKQCEDKCRTFICIDADGNFDESCYPNCYATLCSMEDFGICPQPETTV